MSETRSEGPILTLEDAAELIGGTLVGSGARRVTGVAPLREADGDALGLLADRRYLDHVPDSDAGALLVSAELDDEVADDDRPRVVVEDAHQALATLLDRLYPDEPVEADVHATAVIEEGVTLGEACSVGPYAVIGRGSVLEDGVRVGAHAVVGAGCIIGPGSVLHPHVVLYPGCELGARVILHAGVKLGVDGFGYVFRDGAHRKVRQVGRCIVEDEVEMGANCTVDRGSIGRTRIGKGTKMDNLVHVAHNVDVGELAILVAQVGIAGSTRIGREAQLGGQAGVVGHLEVGEQARIAAQAGVIGDIPAGETVSGYPARNHRDFYRGMAAVLKLPGLIKRVRALEKRLEELEGTET